jgi:tetratricopeptide (TPR) repeat protein
MYMAGGAFPIFYLQSIIQTLSTKKNVQVVVIADACRSGKLAGSEIGGAQATAKILSDQFANEVKILSCQPNESSVEGPGWNGGHGVFTYFLIDGLTGLADRNDDNSVTLLEIQRFLEDNVPPATAPKSQIPLATGNKGFALTKVHPATLAALKAQKAGAPSAAPATAALPGKTSGPGAESDSATLALYRRFERALEQKHLLYPDSGSAYALYQAIQDRPVLEPYRQEMRRNLSAALQDEAQQSINDYLAANPRELRKRWSYDERYTRFPAYLAKSAEILGPGHFMYRDLKTRELYFTGLNLRLQGERSGDAALLKEAAALQLQVLELDSTAAYAYNELGLLARREKEYDRSARYFNLALDISPTWVLAHTNLCGTYINLGQLSNAEKSCRQALRFDSTFALAHYNLGVAYQGTGDYRDAIVQFRQSLRYDPGYPTTYFKLGNAYYFEKNYAQAQAMWLEYTVRNPGDPDGFFNLGELAYETGQAEVALKWYQATLQADPDYNRAYFTTAVVLAAQKQPEKALQALQTALEKGFTDAAQIRKQAELDSIRQMPGYTALMERYFPN